MEIKSDKSFITAVVPNKHKTSLSEFLNIETSGATNGNGTQAKQEIQTDTDDETSSSGSEPTKYVDNPAPRKEPSKEDEGDVSRSGAVIESLEAKVKHNGKEYTVKELINSYETREQIGKRFSEVGSKEARLAEKEKAIKEQEAEIAAINEKWQEMGELVREGKTLQALQILHAMRPENSELDFEDIMAKSMEMVNELNEMSEEEQKNYWAKQKLEMNERAVAKREKKIKATEERTQLENYYNGLLREHNLTDEELDKHLDTISSMPGLKEKYDKFTPAQKIDYCVSYALGQRYLGNINKALESVDSALLENHDLRLALIDNCDPKYTIEDIAECVKAWQIAKQNSANGTSTAQRNGTDANNDTVTTSEKAPDETPGEAEKANKPMTPQDWANLFAR